MAKKVWTAEMRAEQSRKTHARIAAEKQAAADPIPESAPEPVPAEQREPDEPAPLELSSDELLRIRAEARKKVDTELAAARAVERKKVMADALDAEILKQRKDAGLINYQDEIVEFMVDVAPFSDGLVIDGHVYPQGTWLKRSRREYDSMREAMARSWDSEDRAGNPNRKFRREQAGTMNPMLNERMMDDGTFTVGYSPVINGRTGGVA